MSLARRVVNLERWARALGHRRCAECAGLPDYAVDWPEVAAAALVTCPRCGWHVGQIRVEYVEAVAS
jgi:uncharacterized paraquat-inducible protein A